MLLLLGNSSSTQSPSYSSQHLEVERTPTPPQASIPTPPLSSPREVEPEYLTNQHADPSYAPHHQPNKSLSHQVTAQKDASVGLLHSSDTEDGNDEGI